MFKRKLCPRCEMGKYTYELDNRSPMCPYIGCYSKYKCPMFVKLKNPQKRRKFKAIRKKTLSSLPEK